MEPPLAKSNKDPLWIPRHKEPSLEVDWWRQGQVIVYEGQGGPLIQDPVWTSGAARVAWIDVKGRGKARVPKDAGWIIHRRSVKHSALGGVTDAIFSCFLASRFKEDSNWSLVANGIKTSTLLQVVDPTNGGRSVSIPSEHDMSAKGLQWNRRFAKVKVPSVYSKDKWAERRLTDVELADVLDLPGTLRKRLKPSQLAKAREMSVPGKVVVALFESLYALVAGNVCGGREVSKSKVHEQQGLKRKSEGGDMQGPLGSKRSRGVDEDRKSEMVLVESTTLDRCTESAPIGSNRKGNEPFLTVSDKATKSDDAPAPIHLFDNRVLDALHVEEEQRLKATEALDVLRRFGLRLWKRKVRRSFANWLRKWDSGAKTGCNAMVQAGWNACRRADGASCWDWDAGSALLFWRWPEDYQRESWEGVAPYFIGELPSSKSPQPPYEVEEVRRKVSAKLQKVLDRRYIKVVRDSELKSYMFMFDVPKGDSDVRMVYNGSKSGFNDATWAPWFTLPTVETMTRTVLPWGWCGDRDFGEMFLNFPLHPMARLYSGVDLSQLTLNKVKRVEEDHFVGQWTRNAMGLKSSPYLAVQAATRVKRKFLGDQHDSNNPFRWSSCILNLPGSAGYDPTMPWIQKGREDGSIATDLHIYVDDVRITGSSQESVWCAGSRVAKLCSFYGLQDAPRKLREPSQDPGAWAVYFARSCNKICNKGKMAEDTGLHTLVGEQDWNPGRSMEWWNT